MPHELTGVLHVKKETKQISESFKTREFVIKIEDSEYPQYVSFQVKQDRCALLDNYTEGDKIIVTFNINGRRWEKDGKVSFFNSLDAWKIKKLSASSQTEIPATEEHEEDPF